MHGLAWLGLAWLGLAAATFMLLPVASGLYQVKYTMGLFVALIIAMGCPGASYACHLAASWLHSARQGKRVAWQQQKQLPPRFALLPAASGGATHHHCFTMAICIFKFWRKKTKLISVLILFKSV
jgi:hypothetical protein